MKKILFILLLIATPLIAQVELDWSVYTTTILASDSISGTIYKQGDLTDTTYTDGKALTTNMLGGQIIQITVDSAWTSAGIAIQTYNEIEGTWALLYEMDGTLINTAAITVANSVAMKPILMAGVKKVRFISMTAGSYVTQTSTTRIQITTIRY